MGLSEEYANRIGKNAITLGFKEVSTLPLDEWEVLKAGRYEKQEVKDEKEKPIVFIITSTYNGFPPDNAKEFDKFISAKREKSDEPLKGLRYMGMDGSGLSSLGSTVSQDPTAGVSIRYISPDSQPAAKGALSNVNGCPSGPTRHIEVELPEEVKYQAGDHLEISPENEPGLVEKIAIAFGYAPEAVFEVTVDSSTSKSLSSRSLAAVIKGPCTIRNALTYYADLLAAPSRQFLGVCVSAISKEYPELEKDYLEKITIR
ncbi:hypothetical protein K493DRAFT_350065 [Basidiobolus meristosporus CBS 931.73]|uniref:FAD-binding FR-type domain-containing protein n=1 Tax=Basidiobolus meristosporus CBS 931.73 TaxID=1314790 RepID=A0A1Y1YI66_9FUNG|nr:hypothetical protein K493DRAFT_350065 [Basidiobolus meristosporus CBS 931.73]|eukprot:ORX97406.1 hypothetical protein K493DRAFT_350065 [Basidiobolus meristosporus CBS 931.73]